MKLTVRVWVKKSTIQLLDEEAKHLIYKDIIFYHGNKVPYKSYLGRIVHVIDSELHLGKILKLYGDFDTLIEVLVGDIWYTIKESVGN